MAVAEERNFGRAAARLHISQPPITRQIHMLESELGVLLFERTHWGVNLTPAGEELLASASQIEALVDYASDRARRAGLGAIGRLDVGVFGTGSISIVPAILRRYLKANSAVEVIVFNAPQPRSARCVTAATDIDHVRPLPTGRRRSDGRDGRIRGLGARAEGDPSAGKAAGHIGAKPWQGNRWSWRGTYATASG
jgi:DNA-binding transcriptional LysR family regulator